MWRVTYETVREWCLKFGQTYANGIRRRQPRAGAGDCWHLDEVFLKINGQLHYLWRAVDQDGEVLDIMVQSRRDKLRSYSAALAEILPSVAHYRDKWRNNRVENSHQPTRLREKVMRGFKSAGHAQRFLSTFGILTSHFRVGRHLYSAGGYRAIRKLRLASWDEATGAPVSSQPS